MVDFTQNTPGEFQEQLFKKLDCTGQTIRFKVYESCQFIRCAFNETTFHECTFRKCLFRDCDLSLVKVKESSFSQAQFEDCKLIGINWAEARWVRRWISSTVP